MPENAPVIYTIGHSTHTQEDFLGLLHHYEIAQLADIRKSPGSKRYPHFNKENLENVLPCFGVLYEHWPGFGGRRKAGLNSRHVEWNNPSFRAFADYMDSAEFRNEVERLYEFSNSMKTVLMCTEAVWWRCHRALISDYLKENGWEVVHIMPDKSAKPHPFTAAYKSGNAPQNQLKFPER